MVIKQVPIFIQKPLYFQYLPQFIKRLLVDVMLIAEHLIVLFQLSAV